MHKILMPLRVILLREGLCNRKLGTFTLTFPINIKSKAIATL